MRVWAHDRVTFPLPAGHRFPLAQYGLLRERVEAAGLGHVQQSDAATWEALGLVHTAGQERRS